MKTISQIEKVADNARLKITLTAGEPKKLNNLKDKEALIYLNMRKFFDSLT